MHSTSHAAARRRAKLTIIGISLMRGRTAGLGNTRNLTFGRIPKSKLGFGKRLESFSSFIALANRCALSHSKIGFVSAALIVVLGLADMSGVLPVSVPNISGTDLLPVATFGSVLIGSVAAGLAGFAFSAITGSLLFHWVATDDPPYRCCWLCDFRQRNSSALLALWNTMQRKRCLPILVGGLLGIPARRVRASAPQRCRQI